MSDAAAEVIVTGVVQGVGFRYFVYQRARSLTLTGWVRNNPDGSVTSRIEGPSASIHALIDQLKTGPSSAYVRGVSVTWKEYSGEFHSFEITR
jgi:acylphosphatase